MDTLSNDAKQRYRTKLAIVGLDECPYRLPADVWVDDPTRWPDLEYPDLFNYFVNSPGRYRSCDGCRCKFPFVTGFRKC